MNTRLDSGLSAGYKSNSQKARILTENWAVKNLYCPICGNPEICHFPNNREVADFFCPNCHEEYELKSKNGKLGSKIADGAYSTFIQRISDKSSPDFLFMSYSTTDMMVHNLSFVPKFFFVPEIAERRKPLSDNAKRHGWVGCNILYDLIPEQGRIPIIQDAKAVDKKAVLARVKIALKLNIENLDSRGWFFDVLNCVNRIPSKEFTLSQMYQYEDLLAAKHLGNRNIRPKIRQQLQLLRDRGIIEFLGAGRYRKV